MNTRLLKILATAVNALLIADLSIDLWNKYKEWKAKKELASVPIEEEPESEDKD